MFSRRNSSQNKIEQNLKSDKYKVRILQFENMHGVLLFLVEIVLDENFIFNNQTFCQKKTPKMSIFTQKNTKTPKMIDRSSERNKMLHKKVSKK
jgi:hypothetical protein